MRIPIHEQEQSAPTTAVETDTMMPAATLDDRTDPEPEPDRATMTRALRELEAARARDVGDGHRTVAQAEDLAGEQRRHEQRAVVGDRDAGQRREAALVRHDRARRGVDLPDVALGLAAEPGDVEEPACSDGL